MAPKAAKKPADKKPAAKVPATGDKKKKRTKSKVCSALQQLLTVLC